MFDFVLGFIACLALVMLTYELKRTIEELSRNAKHRK